MGANCVFQCTKCLYHFNQMPNLIPKWAGYEAYQMLSIVQVS